jgi:hypothetical protein
MTKAKLLLLVLIASIPSYAQIANRYNVVITEIMADPTPVVGLPNAEFIEIKNVSTTPFNLNGWRLSDATGTATISTSFVLQPDSMVIVCANSNVAAFAVFGRTIGVVSFPSLDNDGDVLTLRSPQNRVIHSVSYSTEWYANEAKKEGGWTLEIIDPKNPCTGKTNWKASTNNLGGTPGKINSVNGVIIDDVPPQLKRAYTTDSVTIILVFDESLDSSLAALVNHYSLPGFAITASIPVAPSFQTVQLKLATPLPISSIYTITVNAVTDCKGNAVGAYNKAKVGLPQVSVANDVVVNEILFNPKSGGSDYVEFYNKSNKVVDASNLYIANKTSSGLVSSLKKLSEEPFYLFPGDYVVVTEDADNVKRSYLVKNEDALLNLSSLPSFPDDKGTVVLINLNGDIIDEVVYENGWHFGLIDNDEGVALERVDPAAASQNKGNWHSAASGVGYGTPTYQNSQFKKMEDITATVEVLPKIFSPDNDGRDDLATISYKVDEAGFVANVIIFDANGRLVRHLVKNDLLQLKGSWNWDGLGENRKKLPIGTYIVFTEVFNLQGKKKNFKNTVILARPLN